MEKTLIGSHNSLSFLPPRQFWLRPFAWIAKCQSLDVAGQWATGVRYFDIRIRFRDNRIISGHGLIDYDIPVNEVLKWIDNRSKTEQCVVRLMLEKKGRQDDDLFLSFVNIVREVHSHILFTGGLRKDPFETIAQLENVREKHCYALFQDYSAQTLLQKIKGFKFPWPWYWAKKNNSGYKESADAFSYTILDFVELD